MALVAAMILGLSVHGFYGVIYPLGVAAVGIVASLIASFQTRLKTSNAQAAIYRGMNLAIILVTAMSAPIAFFLFGGLKEFYATFAGIITVVLLARITPYYTSTSRKPVQGIAKTSVAGPAMNVIFGFARGFESTIFSILVFTSAIVSSYQFSSLYGISMVAVGFLSITATLVAMSSFGPIVDNAKGIIELSKVHKESLKAID